MQVHQTNLVIILIGSFCGGLILGYMVPPLLPRETIYDKLSQANIQYSRTSWYDGKLKYAEYVTHIRDFHQFQNIFEERQNPEYTLPSWISHAYLDASWNVLWIETINSDTAALEYIGFYVYSEPD